MGKQILDFYLVPMHDMSLEDVFTYYNENRFQYEQNFDPGDLDFSLQSQRRRLLRSIIEADRKMAYRFSVITDHRKMIGVVKINNIFDGHQHICEISYFVDKSLDGEIYNALILQRATNMAFHEYHYQKAMLTVLSDHAHDMKTAMDVGYVKIGLMQKNEKINGIWRDFILFEKLNPDFQ